MIAAIIRWSARNVFLVLLATLFVTALGIYAVSRVPLDAIPDLSDALVIVYTEFPGQAPQVVEDQVTYPLTTSMLSVPRSRVVRGFSFFGVSFVYVIFEDGTDLYWDKSTLAWQQDAFRQQVAWAKQRNLPIVIHCRDAFDEQFELLDELKDEITAVMKEEKEEKAVRRLESADR